MSLKYRHSLSLRQAFTGVLFCQIITAHPCLAYDLSDPYSQPSLSGGGGAGLGGAAGKGNANVSFTPSNFGKFSSNPNSKINAPFDELPIEREQYAANGQQIYDRDSTNIYQSNNATGSGPHPVVESGTSWSQAPISRGGLAQTSTTLLSGPATEIPHNKKLTYGFPTGYATTYTGLNYSNGSNPQNGGFLPPTSLGSVDLNIVNNRRIIPKSEVSTPPSMP